MLTSDMNYQRQVSNDKYGDHANLLSLQAPDFVHATSYTVHLESCYALTKGIGSYVHEPQRIKTELNNYTLYRYCKSSAL
jgi:hypothetical protein